MRGEEQETFCKGNNCVYLLFALKQLTGKYSEKERDLFYWIYGFRGVRKASKQSRIAGNAGRL